MSDSIRRNEGIAYFGSGANHVVGSAVGRGAVVTNIGEPAGSPQIGQLLAEVRRAVAEHGAALAGP